jgi:large subunit ribosomal protein L22
MATTDTQTVRAQAKWVRTSARKARVVAEHIRGRSVPEARAVLAFTPRAAARDIEKVLRSAVANAESRPDLLWHGDELVVSAVFVDEGPTLKRWRARARGRVARIRKRTCHITLVLEQSPEAATAARRGRRSRGAAEPAAEGTRRRLPTPRRKPREEAPAVEAVTEPQLEEPELEEPEAEAPAEEPAAEDAKAEAPAEEPAAEEEPKPKRRPSVRRKKTEDEGSE